MSPLPRFLLISCVFILFLPLHQISPGHEIRFGGLGATVESRKIGVFGGLGGVKLIHQIIVMSQISEAFLFQIGFGPEARTFAFDFVQCAVLAIMQHYIAGIDCVRNKHDRTLVLSGTQIEGLNCTDLWK